eukprot:jgi/Orpsp1_1/1174161/evm.model.c7180000049125.1
MNNDQTNQINYLGNASSSCSEPKLNSNGKYFDDGDDNNNKNNNNNYRHFSSVPNIPKGILINRGREMNKYVNETRRSSLHINSNNSNDESCNIKKKNKPHVTFSKGLTTMHEFMSNEWNKAIECEGLKKETLIDLGWRNGTVVHNFNPSKEDEIKLRMGDS